MKPLIHNISNFVLNKTTQGLKVKISKDLKNPVPVKFLGQHNNWWKLEKNLAHDTRLNK